MVHREHKQTQTVTMNITGIMGIKTDTDTFEHARTHAHIHVVKG